MTNLWVDVWYLRDFGRRVKTPKVTPPSKTQRGQKGQSSSPRSGTAPSLDLICDLVWGTDPTVVPGHQFPHLRSQRSKAMETGPRHLPVTYRWPERDHKASARSGKRQGPTQSAAGSLLITFHQLSSPEPPNHCRLHDNHLLPPVPNSRDRDSPNRQPGEGAWMSPPQASEGVSLKAGRSLGLSSWQREASSWSQVGSWDPPWPPIILGRRHRAPR